MTDRPNPYTGLDRAMVRSTRALPITSPVDPTGDLPVLADPVRADDLPDTDQLPTTPTPPARPKGRATRVRAARADDAPDPAIDDRGTATDVATTVPPLPSPRYSDALIEQLRKTVKATGREVSFVRLTMAEKEELIDVLYEFRKRGMKTTENEVNRIAMNYLLLDYRRHGEQSILYRVVAALLA
ncbi:MAG: hypothetical protein NZ518_08255 [Dehalococcoidia bacterium]|nr:hypothetical protein [Dehalococcoidia bacterium]